MDSSAVGTQILGWQPVTKGVLHKFFELPQLTIFSDSPAFTLSGMLFSIAKFIIVIAKSANENDAKTNIQIYPHFSVP